MKAKTIKTIKGISIAIMILMMAVTVMDLYFWIERWQNVNWIDEHIGWQKSIIISYIVSTLMLTAAVICFIIILGLLHKLAVEASEENNLTI